MAKKNHHPVSAEVENNPLYHDTYKLLRCYRDSTYSLMVAVRQVENSIPTGIQHQCRRISRFHLCCRSRSGRQPD